jgi:hypothetical protein
MRDDPADGGAVRVGATGLIGGDEGAVVRLVERESAPDQGAGEVDDRLGAVYDAASPPRLTGGGIGPW